MGETITEQTRTNKVIDHVRHIQLAEGKVLTINLDGVEQASFTVPQGKRFIGHVGVQGSLQTVE